MNTCYNRNESQKHYVESKNPDTKEYIVFDSTYISLWTGKTKSMMTETKMLLKGVGKNWLEKDMRKFSEELEMF